MGSHSGKSAQKSVEIRKTQRYALIGALLWTLMLSGVFIAYMVENRHVVHQIGHSMALVSFNKDVLFRRWGALHGGVYVPETTLTPANPYLGHIPERDITTPSGKNLTLVNPAYMTRQIFELSLNQRDLPQGHITSLNPIRPENSPDPWEKKALQLLERGATEVDEVVDLNGQQHLRFMRPLVTEKPCLRCHASQGYKEGDARGGISVTLSLVPIQKAMNSQLIQVVCVLSFIWLLGLGFGWFGVKKTIRNITALGNERDKLKKSDDRFISLLDNTKIQLWAFDGTSYTYTNREWFTFTGQSPDSPLTLELWASVIHPDDVHKAGKIWKKHWGTKTEHDSYFRLRRHDGVYRNFFCHAVPVKDNTGNFLYFQGSNVDITERKQAEEARSQLEQQFHQAQKLESLGVLAGGVAHDFNNILTVILGHCYMAREDLYADHELKSSYLQIENAANRAADLCRQMLTYAGRTAFVKSRIRLRHLVNDVVNILKSAIKKNVTIELDLQRDEIEIIGDSGQIQQIVMNLIINAAEAIGAAHGTISVVLVDSVLAEQGFTDFFGTPVTTGKYACLTVTDTGCGMDAETQKRIFEPFYSTKFAGRGLGMSAIHGIIRSHNGALQLSSNVGFGTTFKVCFPSQDADSDAIADLAAFQPAENICGTVLLVDDEETLRTMGTSLLEALGFNALTARHGREALEIFRERVGEIDVILLDLIMPEMGGIEAYHELRTISPTIPIIICSGYSVEAVSDVIGKDLYAGFVSKPYKPEQLQEMMTTMTDRKNSRDEVL